MSLFGAFQQVVDFEATKTRPRVRSKSEDSEDTSSVMTSSTSADADADADPTWDSLPSFPQHMDMNAGSASFPAFPTYDDSMHNNAISATGHKSQDFGAFSPFGETTADNKSSVDAKKFSDFFLVTEVEKQQQNLSQDIRPSPSNDPPSLADSSSQSDSESEEGSTSSAAGGAGPGQPGIISSLTNRIWGGVETPVDYHGKAGVSELTLDQVDNWNESQAEPPETSTPQTPQQDQQQQEMQSEDDLLRFEADDFDAWSKTSLSSCSDMELDGFVNKPKSSINWPNPDDHAIEEETEFDLMSRASSKASKSSKASSKKKKKKKKKTNKAEQKETKQSPPENLRNSWSQSSGVLGILQDEHELDNHVNAMPLNMNDSGVDSENELGDALSSNEIFYEAAEEEETIEKEEEYKDSSSVESITKNYRYLQDSLKQMESVDDEDDQEDEKSMHMSLAGLVTAIRGEASVDEDDDPPIAISYSAEESKEPLEEEYDDAQSVVSERSDRIYSNLIATLNGISSGYGSKKGKTSSDYSAASKTMLTESTASLDHGDFNSSNEEDVEDPSPETYAIMEGPFDDISHSAFTAASRVSSITNATLDDLDDSMSQKSWGSRGSRGSRSRRSYQTISTKSSLRSSSRSRRSSGSKSVTFRNLYKPEIFHYDERSVNSGSSTVSDELKSDPYDTKMYSLKKADKPRSTIADSILEDMAAEPLVSRRQKRVNGRNERNIMTEVLNKLKRTRDRLGIEEDSIVSSSSSSNKSTTTHSITLEFDSEDLFTEVVAKLDRIRKLLDSSSDCRYSIDGEETKSEDDSLIKVSYAI
jgi:hypothetical protein